MQTRWTQLCERVSAPLSRAPHAGERADRAGSLFAQLEGLYAHPPRAYHSLVHIADCLKKLDEFAGLARDPVVVEWALWLHDCVYEPTRKDNEARSAEVSARFLGELGADARLAETAGAHIMATRHIGEHLSGDAALVADIDMSILAAEGSAYDRYTAAIRSEYSFASDEDYRKGRGAFLASLLARGAIFHTHEFRGRFEARARANLAREAGQLSG